MKIAFNSVAGGFSALAVSIPRGALAQTAAFQPLNNVARQILSGLQGPLAVSIGTITVIAVGLMCMSGRVPWSWPISACIGFAPIFGAPSIVAMVSSTVGG